MVVRRELPAALMTTSSESVFIIVSVWATAITRAKGTTTGMTDGRISVADSKKASADWPLVGDEVDARQHLRRPDDGQVQNSAAAKTAERATQNIAFDDLHEAAGFRDRD